MSAFAILLHDDEPESNARLIERLEDQYPGGKRFKFSDGIYIVTGPRLVSDVSEGLGMVGPDADAYGVVLRLNGSFSGRSSVRLWDWLKAADQTP